MTLRAFNLALEEGYTLVRKHIIAINGYTDTDNDGFPDTCDAGCLATGLAADPDDDNDGVLDGRIFFLSTRMRASILTVMALVTMPIPTTIMMELLIRQTTSL